METKIESKTKIRDAKDDAHIFLPEVVHPLQEQFIRQVSDDSLPADQVLAEQKEDRASEDSASLFVP
jgi:hypothetical protein